jgi:hypothetical protein
MSTPTPEAIIAEMRRIRDYNALCGEPVETRDVALIEGVERYLAEHAPTPGLGCWSRVHPSKRYPEGK